MANVWRWSKVDGVMVEVPLTVHQQLCVNAFNYLPTPVVAKLRPSVSYVVGDVRVKSYL